MKKALFFLLLGIFSGGQALAANQVMCYTYLKKVKDVEIENLKVWCIGTTDGSQGGMRIRSCSVWDIKWWQQKASRISILRAAILMTDRNYC